MHIVKFYSYSGLSGLPHEYQDDELGDARAYVARRLRKARKSGHHVITLQRGKQWEICEPDDCALIPDSAGVLTMRQAHAYECRECGSPYDDCDDAARCCSDEYSDE